MIYIFFRLFKRSIGASSKSSSRPSLLGYLTQFGYLPQSETEAQLTESQLTNAVRNLQFTAGLNVTGVLDPVTKDLLARPRCGVPDVSNSGYRNKRSAAAARRRVKRYNLQGERWPRTNLTWSLRRGPTSISSSSSGQQNTPPNDIVRR